MKLALFAFTVAFSFLASVASLMADDPAGGAGNSAADKPTNAFPIDRYPAGAAWLKTAPADAAPTVIVADDTPAAGVDGPWRRVKLLLINPTDRAIEYRGYSLDSWSEPPAAGTINPLYRRETRDPAGAWNDAPMGWCKMGSTTMRIPPGEAGEFVAHVAPDATSRVGTILTRTGAAGVETDVLWSPILTPTAGASDDPSR